jgi:hypothetical protein
MRETGQRSCAYCGISLVDTFENWLQMALDHVVPRSVCKSLSIFVDWQEDCFNRVLACLACNGFDNRFKLQVLPACPASLEAFCELRDRIFAERWKRVKICRAEEQEFFSQRHWEQSA